MAFDQIVRLPQMLHDRFSLVKFKIFVLKFPLIFRVPTFLGQALGLAWVRQSPFCHFPSCMMMRQFYSSQPDRVAGLSCSAYYWSPVVAVSQSGPPGSGRGLVSGLEDIQTSVPSRNTLDR